MKDLKTYLFIGLAMLIFAGCKNKKKPSFSGEEPVEVTDLIDFFPSKNAPYSFADSVILRRESDSLLVSHAIFTRFVPDSLLRPVFGRNAKPKFYPMAKIRGKDELYLIAKGISGNKRAAYILAFDKDNNYLDGIPLLVLDNASNTQQLASIDRNLGIHLTVNRRNADGTISEGKDVYGYSAGTGRFSLIMTDALDDKVTELINPIDTFARKHKYSADYGPGGMTIVSIRDGRRSDRLSFFIHIDKNKSTCTGELKGEAVFRSATVAEYRQGGDPCVLRFTFTSNSVTLKELEGCGAHRTLRCSFDGRYAKRPKPRAKPAKK